MRWLLLLITGVFINCNTPVIYDTSLFQIKQNKITPLVFSKDSWKYFLQHLPVKNAPILDYTGKPIVNQLKHFAIINYDVGASDLQQCADALMRFRAEYLFAHKRFEEIGFHFCSGEYYSWSMYCKGLKPLLKGKTLSFVSTNSSSQTYQSLRSYLDIVYAYANTISLCKELEPADNFEVGTVIIKPGSPGHTCIVIDEAIDVDGEKLYKLAEGYMPAQSIYILSNPFNEKISPWYHLNKGEIITASSDLRNYELKKFE